MKKKKRKSVNDLMTSTWKPVIKKDWDMLFPISLKREENSDRFPSNFLKFDKVILQNSYFLDLKRLDEEK